MGPCTSEIPVDMKATELQLQITLKQAGPPTSVTFISVVWVLKQKPHLCF